jgi:ADP-heptose:LPS heptosyltransferase
MPEPLPFEQCEKALTVLHDIIDWVEENEYHKRFSFHHSVTYNDRESFHFALDYRAIYHHPSISLCSQEINDYHFSRYKQEYEASQLFYPHRFMEETKKTNREQFEVLLNQGNEIDKQWYVEHYRELKNFTISYDENMTSVFGFSGDGELIGIVFNKTRWM